MSEGASVGQSSRAEGTPLASPIRLPRPQPLVERIAVRSAGRIVIVPVHAIVRIEACDNHVRLWTDRCLLHKETLTHLSARLDPRRFLRVHRCHVVNVAAVRELARRERGEFDILLSDGTSMRTGRTFRHEVNAAFGLD